MSLVALDGTPLIQVGTILLGGQNSAPAITAVTQDAANEAAIMYGQVFNDDGNSHTIDTTGSSALQWRTSTATFANAGTTFKVGLAAMDTTTGPPGRAVNATDVITFSVSKSMTGGGGGVTANAWQSHVPDSGSLTVANGDFLAFCTQMTARGGSDTINTIVSTSGNSIERPSVTSFTGGAYAAVTAAPNCVIAYSDGHLGFFAASSLISTVTSQAWNNTSGTKEYGNYLQFPFPVKIYGIFSIIALNGDCDFILYSDPLGTPVAEKTVSVDLNAVATNSARPISLLFSSPYTATANQPLAVVAKPTSAVSVTMVYRSLNSSAHQAADHCGTNGYAVNRASGAFAAQNSNKDRFPIGLLLGAFDNGISSTAANPLGGYLV